MRPGHGLQIKQSNFLSGNEVGTSATTCIQFNTFREHWTGLQPNYNTARNYNRMLHEWYIGILQPDGSPLRGRRS